VAAAVAFCYALNPAVIFNSAVWGQIDSTFTFALVLAVVLLWRERPEAATAAYTVAFFIKPQAISLAPLFLAVLVLRYPPVRLLQSAGLALLIGFITIYPFFGLWPWPELVERLAGSANYYAYTSVNTYNLWGIHGFWLPDNSDLGLGLTPRSAGWLLYLTGLLYALPPLVRTLRAERPDLLTLSLFAAYFPFLFVMTLTRMHERYLYPVLPFLLLLAGLCWSRTGHEMDGGQPRRFLGVPLLIYGAVTLLHTMNLYQVYQYYIQPEPGRVPASNDLFWNIFTNARAWSALSVVCFVAFAAFMLDWLPRRLGARSAATTREPATSDGPDVAAPAPASG
jgi:hypothetical protein